MAGAPRTMEPAPGTVLDLSRLATSRRRETAIQALATSEGREALIGLLATSEGRKTVNRALAIPEMRDALSGALDAPDVRAAVLRALDTPDGRAVLSRALREKVHGRRPRLGDAVWADAQIYSGLLMEPARFSTRSGFLAEIVRLSWGSDAFFGMLLYRLRTWLDARRVPGLPRLLHRLSMLWAQMCIGDLVVMHPGVYIPHGQVVIDGMVEIGAGAVISPWVTIGRNGPALEGPTIEEHVFVGTGAKLCGPLRVGARAVIGANAVVLEDVPPDTTVVGVPARAVVAT